MKVFREATANGARKIKLCESFDIPIRTIQRWSKSTIDKRQINKKSPRNKLSNEEKQKIIEISCNKRFRDLSPHEIVPILAEEGQYIASEATMYRVLRKESMINHRTRCKAPQKRHKPEEKKATGPNQVWSWDITYLKTEIKGMFFFLYLFMDVWSRKIVAWDIFEEQTSENAKTVIEKVNLLVDLQNIKLHSDNGSPMKGATFLGTLHKLGIVPSFSRPACSNDNPYSESLFKTLKYTESYPKQFKTLEDAKIWINGFVNWYNNEHRHSMIKYVTPSQRHSGEDRYILQNREKTYKEARIMHPDRFKNKIRDWSWCESVTLNPDTKINKIAS